MVPDRPIAENIDDPVGGSFDAARPIARILAVDDDVNNQKVIKSMLEGVSDELVFASSGREALRYILHMDFALILMDVIMPGLDGYETAALIRNRRRSSRIPIIFLTAADRDDVQMFRGYNAGAVDFVFKPIEPFILRSKVAVFVDLHRKTQEVLLKAEYEKRLLIDNARAKDEKLRIEFELRRSEERQALIMRSLPVAFYRAETPDAAQVRQFVGTGYSAITGWPVGSSDTGIVSWINSIHPDDSERVVAAFRELGDDKSSMSIDYRVRCADGSYRAVLDHAVVTADDNERPKEVVGSLLDITERVSIQEQLIQAQKMEAIGRLTGGIAHDFNNMLHVIVSSLDRLRRRANDNPDLLKPADMALQGALRCADLTRRLLAFSRRQPIMRQAVDLNEIVRSASAMLSRLIGDHIQLKIDCAADLWMTDTDPAQIESAIINLAINARDAMPSGGQLMINTSNVLERGRGTAGTEGEFVVVTVTDTGCGIAADALGKIFEPFFTTKKAGHGTGLGLSIIYNYVQQAGGNIEVLSEVGRGTSVKLMLPRSQADHAQTERPRPNSNEITPRGNGELILVVEDDEVVRSQAVIMLSDIGYDVVEAENARFALELLGSRSDIRMMFTDVAMPGELNGFELAELAMRQWPQLKVLFTSGNPDFASGRKQAPTAKHNLLRKPYRGYELARAIREALLYKVETVGHASGPDDLNRVVSDLMP